MIDTVIDRVLCPLEPSVYSDSADSESEQAEIPKHESVAGVIQHDALVGIPGSHSGEPLPGKEEP